MSSKSTGISSSPSMLFWFLSSIFSRLLNFAVLDHAWESSRSSVRLLNRAGFLDDIKLLLSCLDIILNSLVSLDSVTLTRFWLTFIRRAVRVLNCSVCWNNSWWSVVSKYMSPNAKLAVDFIVLLFLQVKQSLPASEGVVWLSIHLGTQQLWAIHLSCFFWFEPDKIFFADHLDWVSRKMLSRWELLNEVPHLFEFSLLSKAPEDDAQNGLRYWGTD